MKGMTLYKTESPDSRDTWWEIRWYVHSLEWVFLSETVTYILTAECYLCALNISCLFKNCEHYESLSDIHKEATSFPDKHGTWVFHTEMEFPPPPPLIRVKYLLQKKLSYLSLPLYLSFSSSHTRTGTAYLTMLSSPSKLQPPSTTASNITPFTTDDFKGFG